MIEHVDAGDVVDVEPVAILPDETGMSLYYKLVDAALVLFDRVLTMAQDAPLPSRRQTGAASYHWRSVPFGGRIDPGWSRERIDRFIRALWFPPLPSAFVEWKGKRIPIRTLQEYDDWTINRQARIEHQGSATRCCETVACACGSASPDEDRLAVLNV